MTGNGFLHCHSRKIPKHSIHIPNSVLFTFPFGYSHSRNIPEHVQQSNKVQMQTVDSRATVPQKIGHQSLRNNNYKNTIHHTLKIRLNISSHLSKYVGIFSHGNRSYSHSHQRSFSLIPIPKLESYSHSRGIPVPTGNLILYCWHTRHGS